jgi:YHS domain-containing protein
MEESYGLQDYSDGSAVFSVDPVCGSKVDEAQAAGKTGYAGVTYYFCSTDCKVRFEEDPGLYLGLRH